MTNISPLTNKEIRELAGSYGFAAAYAIRPQPLGPLWHAMCFGTPPHTGGLCLNPAQAYLDARCVLLLARAYRPFAVETGLPGYYVASNAGYHAANAFAAHLLERGFLADRLEVPLPALVTAAQVGTLCKNALIDLPGLGTRTALFTIATNACLPDESFPAPPMPCGDCTDCTGACPAGAIHPVYGLDAKKCLRTYMENDDMPEWVMQRLPGLLGCEICMAACGRNAGNPPRAASTGEAAAFDLQRLLRGEIADARALVGKNMCTRGRLPVHAALLAAQRKQKELLPDIEALCAYPLPSVHKPAIWAYHFLRNL